MQCKSNGHRDVGTGYFEHIWLESCMAQVVDLPAEPLHLSMLDQNTKQTKEMWQKRGRSSKMNQNTTKKHKQSSEPWCVTARRWALPFMTTAHGNDICQSMSWTLLPVMPMTWLTWEVEREGNAGLVWRCVSLHGILELGTLRTSNHRHEHQHQCHKWPGFI